MPYPVLTLQLPKSLEILEANQAENLHEVVMMPFYGR